MQVIAQLDALVLLIRSGLTARGMPDLGVGNCLWGCPIEGDEIGQLFSGWLVYLSKKAYASERDWSEGGNLRRVWTLSVITRLFLTVDAPDVLAVAGRRMEAMEAAVLRTVHLAYNSSLFAEPPKSTGGSSQTRTSDGQYFTWSEHLFDVVSMATYDDLKR